MYHSRWRSAWGKTGRRRKWETTNQLFEYYRTS